MQNYREIRITEKPEIRTDLKIGLRIQREESNTREERVWSRDIDVNTDGIQGRGLVRG